MGRGKDSLVLPYTYTPSSSTVGLLLHLQYYQKCKSITLKMFVKSKFVFWQPHYNNFVVEKNGKKIHVFKYSFFRKRTALPISINYLQTPFLDDILLRNFTLSNSIVLLEDRITWKGGFEVFLIDDFGVDIAGNKNIAGKYQKSLVSVSPTLY